MRSWVTTLGLGTIAAVAIGACTFGSGGDGGGPALPDSTSSDGTTSDGTLPPAGTSNGSNSASGGTSTSGSTGPGVDVTSDGSEGDTAPPPADSSTSAPEPMTGTDSSGGGTTGGDPGPAYPACPTGEDAECGAGFNCVPTVNNWGSIDYTYCGDTACMPGGGGGECPVPATGNADPFCIQLSTPVCTLSCGGGQTCPDGMDCIGVLFGMTPASICSWAN
jgi:hypothetical protein